MGVLVVEQCVRWMRTLRLEGSVASLTVLNLVATFVLQIAVFRILGASRETDAYFAAAAIPQVALAILVATSSAALVPFLVRLQTEDRAAATRMLLVRAGGGLLLPSILLATTADLWTGWLFAGFDEGPSAALAARLNGVIVLCIPAIAATAILSSAHYARGTFVRAELVGAFCNWLMVCGIVAALPEWGVLSAAYGVLLRFCVQAVLLSSPAYGEWGRKVPLSDLWRKTQPLLAGNVYLKSDTLVDRHLLSMAAPGALSLVALAQSIYQPIAGVLGQALATTALPRLSTEPDGVIHTELFRRNLLFLAIFSASAVTVAVVAAEPILSFLSKGGTASSDEVELWKVLAILSGVPVFGAMGSLVAIAFYAAGDTRTPMIVSVVSFTAFIVVRILVFEHFGVYAFCAAISFYYATNFTALAGILLIRGAAK